MVDDNGSRRVFDFSVVTLILRLSLGALFFFAGLGKFLGGYGEFASGMMKNFVENTWLPTVALWPYVHALPFIEVAVGALLIVGLFTRPVLAFTGLLLVSLQFGMQLLGNNAVVASNANYVFIAAIAYYFSQYNLFSVDGLVLRGAAKR